MFEFIDVKYENILDLPKIFIEKGKITSHAATVHSLTKRNNFILI